MAATPPPLDADRGGAELRALDCNLSALCDHILVEGFNSGSFSDVVVLAMGSTYHLHRLILSRSSYFRNMLHGPWKESDSRTVTLQIDDDNVNSEAIATALAYLYGHHPKLNDDNAFRVLAAASFLDLQDLCAICTDFIISELWTSNFLTYQMFAERQDYGVYGERVRKACWGYLCQSGAVELREVLPKLSSQTLHSLLTSDRLWVPSEEKRFELALYTLLTKIALHKEERSRLCPNSTSISSESSTSRAKILMHENKKNHLTASALEHLRIEDMEEQKDAQSFLSAFADPVVAFQSTVSCSKSSQPGELPSYLPIIDRHSNQMTENDTMNGSFTSANRTSCSYAELLNQNDQNRMGMHNPAIEGPSDESTTSQLSSNIWLPGGQQSSPSDNLSCNFVSPEWGNSNVEPSSWGARTVGSRQEKNDIMDSIIQREEYDAFHNIFEGGSLLYANMSFEALLNVRKQLEELGFPCKAVNDGLWLQMLLSHRVQEIGADTCRNCCLTSMSCACRQPYGYSQGGTSVGYYRQEYDRGNTSGNTGNLYLADPQGDGSGLYGPVRVHVRGPIDGLAGIGRGATFITSPAWPPTRYVFSRVPLPNRNGHQSPANEEPEARVDISGDLSGDGLTALVGTNQNGNIFPANLESAERVYVAGPAILPNTSNHPVQMLETQEQTIGLDWESGDASSISLDLKTPLRHFPPFRFGVEFEDVHRLGDGQVKHSPEVFYAGSLWKVSVQAFNDEDPQGRRTLGLFLHRRKAEPVDSLRKAHMYVDSREKVTARYQLICPSKREIMVFGSLKQPGTLLPKAPKGWGWRTALLFDELADLLQGGALRVAAVVQLI